MKNLKIISKELFNKIRGRFPTVSTGDESGKVTSDPTNARFFEFDYRDNDDPLGKVTISLNDEDGLTVMFNSDMLDDGNEVSKDNWYSFLRELRSFAKKRLLNFDTRDIERSTLKKRDYAQLAQTEAGDNDMMAENKMYGTSRTSYQDVGQARLMLKHKAPVNLEVPAGRTQRVESIFIESPTGERFKYPFKHLSGARAMARHVAEGGVPHDTFGSHITSLSEELANLKKFKTYMGRSSVMAESLSGYMDVVKERVVSVKDRVAKLQKENYYKEAIDTYEGSELTEVPENIQSDWIAELTIKQFNEELKDVFPYIYKLVGEATKAKMLNPDDLEEVAGPKSCWDGYKKDGTQAGTGKNKGKRVNKCVPEESEYEEKLGSLMGQWNEDETDVAYSSESNVNDHGQQTPVTEYILSMFDRDAGKFPKGETAILTAIEKDYGESYITPAKEFIGRLNELCAQHGQYTEDDDDDDYEDDVEMPKFGHDEHGVKYPGFGDYLDGDDEEGEEDKTDAMRDMFGDPTADLNKMMKSVSPGKKEDMQANEDLARIISLSGMGHSKLI
jgi:hypothetical protein